MRIDGLPDLPPKVTQGNQRTDSAKVGKSARGEDVVELSQSAKEVADLAAAAKQERVNPRIEAVRERVTSGYYDSQEVRERIADRLLRSGNLQEVVDEIVVSKGAKQQLDEIPDTRPARVDEAKQRVSGGFYDTPEVRNETAERILDEL